MATGSLLQEGASIVSGGVGVIQHIARAAAPSVKTPGKGSLGTAEQAIQKASEKYKINPAYLWGVYGVETSHGSDVTTSSTGAKGSFQFEPETAKEYNYPYTNSTTPQIFQEQADAAAHYLSSLGINKDPSGALAAYSGHTPGYYEKVVESAKTWGKAGSTENLNAQETEKVEAERASYAPEEGTWGKFGELGVKLILVLVGAALLVYGVMVMVRPREKALSVPVPKAIPV